ncbi:cyclin-T2-like isoform X2 [Gigantopelta aegis]|nr:cyclin-T2-like isoform X2 [Gigantopelta aegis]
MAPACLFLAAKVEEQLRKLEHVLKVAHMCLHREGPALDVKSETYLEQAQELVTNENILLQTLGFDMQVDHPHSTVVRTSQLVKAHKDLAQTSYFLATNSLHLTTMCLQYKPSVVACVCIYLASKWSEYEIQESHEGKDWFWYVDENISLVLLENLMQEFLDILERCPSRLKQKILKWKSGHRVEESFGPPPEKRHRGESTNEPAAGTSRTAEKKSESSLKHKKPESAASHGQSVSKTKHSEPGADTPKVTTHSNKVSMPASRSLENPIPVAKSQELNSVPESAASASVQPAEVPSAGQVKKREMIEKISLKDYKQYREYKEKKERESAAVLQSADRSTESELRPSEQSSKQSESHRKEQYQHEKHVKSEPNLKIQKIQVSPEVRKHDIGHLKKEKSEASVRVKAETVSVANKMQRNSSGDHVKMEASEVINPLKLHIKRGEQGTHTVQPSGSPLKIKIKTHHSKEHKSERHSKSRDKSLTEEPKPALKLKLTEQMLKSHNQHIEKKSKHRRTESQSSREAKQTATHQPETNSERLNSSHPKHTGGKSRSSSKHASEKTKTVFSPLAGGSNSLDVSGATNSTDIYGEGNGVHNPSALDDAGVRANGGGFHSPQIPLTPTKENLGQLNIQLQQLINQSKLHIAQQQQQQQQQYNHQPLLPPPLPPLPSNPMHGMYPTDYIAHPVYHGGPPLPHAPPPPPPPENPPPPPPPPHQSY